MFEIFRFLLIFTTFTLNGALVQNHYKRLMLEGEEWTVYIGKTTTYSIKSVIECGSACSANLDNTCDLFVLHLSTKLCHIGYLSNDDTNYLTDDGSEPQRVYVNVGRC